MFKKKYYLVLDVETANDVDCPFTYDLGYAIIDRHGTIYTEKSLIIRDIFCNEPELMGSCYYEAKRPLYWNDIRAKKSKIVTFYEARNTIKADIEKYNIDSVYAYNAFFDITALNNTQRWLTKSKYRYFLPRGVEVKCIWHMACQTICSQTTYIRWAIENGFVSPSGNIQTSAEVVNRYITAEYDFNEKHQGLDDVHIEAEILVRILKQHKAVNNSINRYCWQIPQNKKKLMGL